MSEITDLLGSDAAAALNPLERLKLEQAEALLARFRVHVPEPATPVAGAVALCTCGEKIIRRGTDWQHFGTDVPYEEVEL